MSVIERITQRVRGETSYGGGSGWLETFRGPLRDITGDRLGRIGVIIMSVFVLIGVFGPVIAPYEPFVSQRSPTGEFLRISSPSVQHPMGTTVYGYDVLSQLILGARVSIIVGSVAAAISVFIGTNVGLISGYYGGRIDAVLMRITDIMYAMPLLPFALVFVVIAGQSLLTIIIAIVLVMWRSTARVIRSQVLSHRERPYVESARASGASDFRIMYLHILPNVLPLAFLYGAFSVGWSIIMEANLSFLGFGDPNTISWGRMVFQAYNADVIRRAWFWILPPGLCIALFVMSVFFIARAMEKSIHPGLRHRGNK